MFLVPSRVPGHAMGVDTRRVLTGLDVGRDVGRQPAGRPFLDPAPRRRLWQRAICRGCRGSRQRAAITFGQMWVQRYSTRLTVTLVSTSRTLLTSQFDLKVEFPVNSTVYPMICVHPFDVVELPVNRTAELGV